MAVSILIVDDHAMVRSGLRLLLEEEDDFGVVAEAGEVESAIERAREHLPKVILLDLHMPGRASVPAIPDLLEAAPGAAVVVMTMHDDPAFARAALVGGASGFVLKEAAQWELVQAVREAAAGRTYLNPTLGARLATLAPDSKPAAEQPATDEDGDLAIGSTFAGHRIESIAGRGGMGVVYRATDLILDRRVALKLIVPGLAADPVFRARFERECRLAAALDHPHIVPIFRAGVEHGALYVTMRYVEGTDLRSLLAEEQRLDAPRAVDHPRPGRRRARRGAPPRARPPRREARQRPHHPPRARRARVPDRLRDHEGAGGAGQPHEDRLRGRDRRLHGARSRRRAARSTRAPTSTRSAASSTAR